MTARHASSLIRTLLAHPLTRGMSIDDVRVTELRGQIVQANHFLRQIYEEWYVGLAAAVPDGPGSVLELGSGPGFLGEYIPGLVTSEIAHYPNVSVVLDGQRLPLADRSLRGIVMSNVLHHLPQPRSFLVEAARCVRAGGVVVMNEPWVTRWSRWVYQGLHHEHHDPFARAWEVVSNGPLSSANSALPWIIFARDRERFEREFPEWQLDDITLLMPLRYLVSGGVSMRALMPGWTFRFWRGLERLLQPWMGSLAMFARIVLSRVG